MWKRLAKTALKRAFKKAPEEMADKALELAVAYAPRGLRTSSLKWVAERLVAVAQRLKLDPGAVADILHEVADEVGS